MGGVLLIVTTIAGWLLQLFVNKDMTHQALERRRGFWEPEEKLVYFATHFIHSHLFVGGGSGFDHAYSSANSDFSSPVFEF